MEEKIQDGSGKPLTEAAPLKPGIRSMWKLLQPSDWRLAGNPSNPDDVEHKRYDIRFYADCGGVCYRNAKGHPVYEPSIWAYLLLRFRTFDFLARVKRANGCPIEPEGILPRREPMAERSRREAQP